MIPICIDIETRPQFVHDDELERIALASKANPKRTDETRAEWAADRDNQVAAWSRESLSLVGSRICAIALRGDGISHAWADWLYEDRLLSNLDYVLSGLGGPFIWVGHNIAAFDLPILRIAAMRHDMPQLRRRIPTYRYDKAIHDNMTQAIQPAGSFAGVSADALAKAIGIEGKGDLAEVDFVKLYSMALHGSSGEVQAVEATLKARCQRDVDVEWATYERMNG
jgi:hypothetical protein